MGASPKPKGVREHVDNLGLVAPVWRLTKTIVPLLAQRLRVYTRTTLLIHVVLRVSTLSPKHAVHALSLKYNARPLWPEGTLVDDRA